MRVSDWGEVEKEEGEMAQYRTRTVALLLKYFRMSVELGHLPSLFGREFFRSNVSSYATHTFEDTAIFVLDMERVLSKLSAEAQAILARVIFQQYSYDEAAELLGIGRRTLVRKVAIALDSCSRVLLDGALMERVRVPLSAKVVDDLSKGDELPAKLPPISTALMIFNRRMPKCCQVGWDGRIQLRG
jgi:predicted DNA-binding protein (UPF0251 family)